MNYILTGNSIMRVILQKVITSNWYKNNIKPMVTLPGLLTVIFPVALAVVTFNQQQKIEGFDKMLRSQDSLIKLFYTLNEGINMQLVSMDSNLILNAQIYRSSKSNTRVLLNQDISSLQNTIVEIQEIIRYDRNRGKNDSMFINDAQNMFRRLHTCFTRNQQNPYLLEHRDLYGLWTRTHTDIMELHSTWNMKCGPLTSEEQQRTKVSPLEILKVFRSIDKVFNATETILNSDDIPPIFVQKKS